MFCPSSTPGLYGKNEGKNKTVLLLLQLLFVDLVSIKGKSEKGTQ